MPEDYSYIPPEVGFVNEGGLFEVVAPALLMDRHMYNRIWAEEKAKRHQENLSRLDERFYKGTYYRGGVGQPHSK